MKKILLFLSIVILACSCFEDKKNDPQPLQIVDPIKDTTITKDTTIIKDTISHDSVKVDTVVKTIIKFYQKVYNNDEAKEIYSRYFVEIIDSSNYDSIMVKANISFLKDTLNVKISRTQFNQILNPSSGSSSDPTLIINNDSIKVNLMDYYGDGTEYYLIYQTKKAGNLFDRYEVRFIKSSSNTIFNNEIVQ